MKHFLLLIGLSLLIASCSITKRRYTSGWHVEWHQKHHNSGGETLAVENNSSIRLAEAQTTDAVSESNLAEAPTTTEPETISLIEESETISSTEDTPSLTEDHEGTTTSASPGIPEKTTSGDEPDEPKKETPPDSERVIPIALAVLLSILLLGVGGYLSALIAAIFYILLTLSVSGFSVIGAAMAIFLGAIFFALVLFLMLQLYNRKKTKYSSRHERNMMYLLIAFSIAGGLGLIVWAAMSSSVW